MKKRIASRRVASVVATIVLAQGLLACGQKGPLIAVAPSRPAASSPTAPPPPPEPLEPVIPGTAPR